MGGCTTKSRKENSPTVIKSTRWRETVDLYRSSATIHGIAKTGEHQLYNFRPIIWIVLTFAMAVVLVVMLYIQFTRYFSYPTLTQVNAVFNKELEFPAVTICNLNMFTKDIQNCSGPDFQYAYMDMLEDMSDVSILESLLELPLAAPIQFDIPGEALQECSDEYAHKLDSMLGYCVWEGTLKNCSEIFRKSITEFGTCFTFNSKMSSRVSTRSSGSNAGLHIILNIQQDEYFFSKSLHAGVKIVLHEPEEEPFPASRGVYIGPGMAAAIAIKKEKTKALAYPYKGLGSDYCLDTQSTDFINPLKRYKFYSSTACMSECDINKTVKGCGCRFFLDPGDDAICSLLDTQYCYLSELNIAMASRLYRDNCSCPIPCSETKYEAAVSYTKFGSDFINDVLNQRDLLPDEEYVRNNFIDVRLYYDSLVVTETTQVPEMTIGGILGSFGGLMGLFLGASLLSMSEILELLLLLITQNLRRRSKKDDDNHETLTDMSESKFT